MTNREKIKLRPTLEQIYFARAIQAVEEAKQQSTAAAEHDHLFWLWRMVDEMHDLGDEVDPDEDPTIAAGRLALGLGHAFGLFLQSLILSHVFCAMTLEAHVNNTASRHLPGSLRDAFDRLPLRDKWLFLPRLLSRDGFEPGAEPFQGFTTLVTLRNRLVHAKGEDLVFLLRRGADSRALLDDGITDAENSLQVVHSMVHALAGLLGSPVPSWLEHAESTPYLLEYGA